MRVCGERCGLWRLGFGAVKEKVLSLGADSLCESALWVRVEVREWFFTNSLKSMGYLRTNRASFCVALGSKGDCTAAVWRHHIQLRAIFIDQDLIPMRGIARFNLHTYLTSAKSSLSFSITPSPFGDKCHQVGRTFCAPLK